MTIRSAAWCAVVSLAAMAATARAVDPQTRSAAEKLVADRAGAIVWITANISVTPTGGGMSLGQAREQRVDAVGTVVDPSGLVVLSYAQLDPTSAMGEVSFGGQTVSFETRVTDVKMRLPDGTAVPASVVMKDANIDLGFIKPDPNSAAVKGKQFAAIDFSQGGSAKLLDDLILLTRLNKAMDYQPAVFLTQVSAAPDQQRNFYFAFALAYGVPLFTADGKPLGLAVVRKGSEEAERSLLSNLPVILPAQVVHQAAQQATTRPYMPQTAPATGPATTTAAPPAAPK